MSPASLPPQRPPRILFVVMSAVAPATTVDQLARSLAPHLVLVHHDHAQQPEFSLSAPNVRFVKNPARTGWGVFGFVEGIFKALSQALDEFDFDYLQLLSPSCLPCKPMALFEAHVQGPHDAHFGAIDLRADEDVLMNVGWRAFTPEGSFRHRVARRVSRDYFADDWCRRDEAGVWLRSARPAGPLPWLARAMMRALSHPAIGRHLFDAGLPPYYGSVWFGARRQVVRSITGAFTHRGLRDYFRHVHLSEEFLIPTLLMQAASHPGPLNHYIKRFDEAHPGVLVEDELEELRQQPAFFARKFPADVAARVRWRVLEELCSPDAVSDPPGDWEGVRSAPGRRGASQGGATVPGVPAAPRTGLAGGT